MFGYRNITLVVMSLFMLDILLYGYFGDLSLSRYAGLIAGYFILFQWMVLPFIVIMIKIYKAIRNFLVSSNLCQMTDSEQKEYIRNKPYVVLKGNHKWVFSKYHLFMHDGEKEDLSHIINKYRNADKLKAEKKSKKQVEENLKKRMQL